MFLRNFFKNNIRYLINLLIKDKYKVIVGKTIRYIHKLYMFFILLILFFIKKKYIKYIFIFIIFISILFILNDFGCIISFIERELLKDNYCVTDYYLELIKLDKNNDNRIIISLFGFYLQLYILILIYYFKNL